MGTLPVGISAAAQWCHLCIIICISCVYVLSLRTTIARHCIDRHGFADDRKLYSRLPRRDLRCIAELCICMSRNKLKLNDTKTECMVITGKNIRQVNGVAVHIGEDILRSVS